MNRGNFLKLLATIALAPRVLLDTSDPNDPEARVLPPGEGHMMVGVWWKVEAIDAANEIYMKDLINNQDSPLLVKARDCGLDTTKPFQVQTGYVADDFIRDRFTLVLRQFVPAA